MAARANRMTSLDAAFYHLEKTGQLLHVAGVYTVEGALDFERMRADVAARLHLIPRYTERVVPVPLNLSHPTWEPDPGFDIRRHVVRHHLKAPGDDAQLVSLVSRLFAQPLDRRLPLWELHQIDGYRGDRTAIFCKVHHCMIDGVSGVQLLGVLFDPSPNPAPIPPPEHTEEAPPLPSPLVQLTRAVAENVSAATANARSLAERLRRPSRFLAELSEAADAAGELLGVAFKSPPPTPFNGHVSTLRRVVWTTFSMNTTKAIKNRLGGTVNDVVLATISAALRRYLESKGINADRTELRAMLPVNVRRADEHLHLGNRVSMLMAPLPVGIFDPTERYRQVRAATALLKEQRQASRWTRLLELVEMLPAPIQAPIGRLQLTAAPINTICTNIPGPPVSLYVQGKRLETLAPVVPLAQGVGLAFAILSYADSLTIGITADPALVPDVDSLCGFLQDGFEELRGIAGVEVTDRRGPVRPERQRRLEPVPPRVA
jgi:WS/DGAT/MGAT family acyltransferase